MKKGLILLLFVTGAIFSTYAQRYIPGQKGIQFTGGLSDKLEVRHQDGQAFYFGAAISTYNKKANRWVFGAEYWQRKYEYKYLLLPVSQITLEGGHYICFIRDPSKTMFLSIGGSLLTGYETLNWSKNTLFDGSMINAKDGFIYGGALTLELETFLTDKVIFLVSAREKCLFGTSISKFHFQVGIGLKFLIN